MPVDDDASSGAASRVSSNSHALMVRCNATAWTDETEEGRLKVLVTRSDPVTGAAVTTAEQTMPRMALMGTPAESPSPLVTGKHRAKWSSGLGHLHGPGERAGGHPPAADQSSPTHQGDEALGTPPT